MATTITAAQTTSLKTDTDLDGVIDPGEVVTTKVVITNTGAEATSVSLTETLSGMTLVGGSLNVSPLAMDDAYVGVGNVKVTANAASGLLANDAEFLGATFGSGAGQTSATAGTFATGQGGSIVIAADGSFVYTPKIGFSGTDTVTYTVTDAGGLTSTATASFNVSTPVWFIDNTAPGSANLGTQADPFTSMAAFNAANAAGGANDPAASDLIYLRAGTYAETDGINLRDGQVLTGQGQNLTVTHPTAGPITVETGSVGETPVIRVTEANEGVSLASGNTVRGLDIDSTNTGAVALEDTNGTVGTLTVSDVTIGGVGQGIDIDQGGTLNVVLDGLTSSGSSNQGIDLQGVSGSVTVVGGAISAAAGGAVNISGGSVSLTYNGSITQAVNNKAMVSVSGGHTGTVTFQNGTVSDTKGTGLQFDNADGTYTFNGTTTLNGGDAGIDILNGSTGSFTFGSNTSITHDGNGDAFEISASNANVTYSGSISDAKGYAVDIDNHDGGTVTFQTGSISGSSKDANGIRVTNSNGGAVNFNNPSITLSTQGNDAVTLTGNTGGAINFNTTGGGLDITTTTGAGFTATGGGTVSVTGSDNTISSGTGTALNIANTTIGAADVTFKSISANGGTNGIVLNNTGSAGGLTVTGDGVNAAQGGNGSGGIIQNTTGVGIVLQDTTDVSLNYVNVTNAGTDGITANNINGFTLNRSYVSDSVGAAQDRGLEFGNFSTGTNVNGTININNSIIGPATGNAPHDNLAAGISGGTSTWNITGNNLSNSGNAGINIEIRNAAIVSDMMIFGNTFHATNINTAQGIHIQAAGTSTGSITATIKNNDFKNNNIAIDVNGDGSAITTYNILNNNIINTWRNDPAPAAGSDTSSHAINVFMSTLSTSAALMNVRIEDNMIGDAAIDGSGSSIGSGMRINFNGNGRGNVLIDSNVIREAPIGRGIEVIGRNGTGQLDVTITNNDVDHTNLAFDTSNGSDFPLGAIVVQSNTVPTAGYTVRVHAQGNIVPTAGGALPAASETTGTYLSLQELPFGAGTSNLQLVDIGPGSASATAELQSHNTGDAGANAGVTLIAGPINVPPAPLLAEIDGLEVPPPLAADVADEDQPLADQAVQEPLAALELDSLSAGGEGREDVPPHTLAEINARSGAGVSTPAVLTQAQLDALVEAAIGRWEAAGLSAEQVAALRALTFEVSSMGGWHLASADGTTITVDDDGAGRGWFVDGTPGDDVEFARTADAGGDGTVRLLADGGDAAGRMDLLTTLMHEMGHALGLGDSYASDDRDGLMYGVLPTGERRLPASGSAQGSSPDLEAGHAAFLGAPVDVANLPAGRSVTVQWDATVNAQTNGKIADLVNKGTVSASNAPTVQTNTVTTTLDSLTLGGTVFKDADADGTFDGGESGVNGVAVTLFADTNANGELDGGDALVATTTTAGGGAYSFAGLAPGEYLVRLDEANFGAGQPLADLTKASPYGGDPDASNTDGDSNGVKVAGDGVQSRAITLAYNTEPTAGTGNDTNTTLDFGLIAPNKAPAGADKTASLLEDGTRALTAADFGFTDADGHALAAVKFTTLPTAGTLTYDADGAGAGAAVAVTKDQEISKADIDAGKLVFTPAANANGAGYASLTFQVRDDGGTDNGGVDLDQSANTLTFDVTSVNDAPVGASATLTITEDVARVLTAADFGFSDPSDSPANALSAVVVSTLPGAGSLTLNGAPVGMGDAVPVSAINLGQLVYTPALNATGPGAASFTFKVRDDGGVANGGANEGSTSWTIAFDITSVNDAPVAVAAANAAYTENAAGTTLSSGLTLSDVDLPAQGLTGATVVIGAGRQSGDTLTFLSSGSITGSYDGSTGTLTLSGAGTLAEYETVLRTVKFSSSSDNPTGAARTITWQVNDGQGVNNLSAGVTTTVAVTQVNDVPTMTDGGTSSATFVTGSGGVAVNPTITAADLDDVNLTQMGVVITNRPDGANETLSLNAAATLAASNAGLTVSFNPATWVLKVSGTAPVATYQAIMQGVVYDNAAASPDPATRTLSFQLRDNGGGTGVDGFSNAQLAQVVLNQPPVVSVNTGATVSEGALTVIADTQLKATDAETADPASLTFKVTSAATKGTLFLDADGDGQVDMGEALGLNATFTQKDVNDGKLKYMHDGSEPSAAGFGFTVSDGQSSTAGTFTFTVTPTNDAPSGADKTATVLEDGVYVLGAADFGFSDGTDAPANGLSAVKITTLPGAGALTLNNVAVTAGQFVSKADLDAGLLKFAPAANADGSGYAALTFQVQDDGGTADGGVDLDQSANTLTFDVTGVNDAPSGTDGTVSATEDTDYVFAAADFGLTDPDDAPADMLAAVKIATLPAAGSLTLNGAAVSAGQEVSLADLNAGLLKFTPAANANGATYASLTFQVRDNGGTANGGVDLDASANTLTIAVSSVNDQPTITGLDAVINRVEQTEAVIDADVVLADPDLGALRGGAGDYTGAVLTIERQGGANAEDAFSLPGGVYVAQNGVIRDTSRDAAFATYTNTGGRLVITFTGAEQAALAALVNALAQSVAYRNLSDTPPASVVLSLSLSDGNAGAQGSGGALSATATVTVNLEAVNDAPVNTVLASIAGTEDVVLAVTGISVADVDAGGASLTVTLEVATGTLAATSGAGVTVGGAGTGTVTLTGSATDLNAFIAAAGVSYTPVANANGDVTLTVTTSDGGAAGSGGTLTDVDVVTLSMAAVNDAPAATAPGGGYSATENVAVSLKNSGLSVADLDADAQTMTATLSVAEGTLNVTAGTSGATVSGSGTGTVTITGSQAQINALLNTDATSTVSYVDNDDTPSSNVNLTLSVSDNGNTGSGGTLTASASATIAVTAVNDAPVNTIAGPVTTDEDTIVAVTGITVADADATSVRTTLSVITGTLTASSGAGVTVSGSGSGSVQLAGTSAAINAFIAASGVTYTPLAGANGPVQLTVTTTDDGQTGTGGTLSDTDIGSIVINPVNDAPMHVGLPPAQSGSEDVDLTINGLAIDDIDAGSAALTTTLSVANGTLSVAALGGASVSGSGSDTVTITGTTAQINAALAGGVTYRGDANVNGADVLTVTTDDGGATGSGGAKSVTSTVAITLAAVNDAPAIATSAGSTVAPEESATLVDAALVLTDVDSATLNGAQVRITGGFVTGQDVLGFTNQNGITGGYNAATGVLTLSGAASVAAYQAALRSVTYIANSDTPDTGARTISFMAEDSSGAVGLAATKTVSVTDTPPDPGPGPAPQPESAIESLGTAFESVTFVELDSPQAQSPTITLSDGTVVANPAYGQAQRMLELAGLVDDGELTLDAALNEIAGFADATTTVATLTYQFFTGKTPTAAGYDFLIQSDANPNDLNDPYYGKFNLENRYINFAVNLGKLGEGAERFAADYAGLTLDQALAKAYGAIFGFAPDQAKIDAILGGQVTFGGQVHTRAEYFAAYGLDGPNGMGTKAAMVGWLLAEAVKADLGPYAQANLNFLADLADDGNADFNINLLADYASPVELTGHHSANEHDGSLM